MNSEILRIMGHIGGIGGLALGVLLIVFRDVIRKTVLSRLTREQAYKLLRMIIALVFLVALAGLYVGNSDPIETRIKNADIQPRTDIPLEKGGSVTFKVDVSYHLSARFGSVQIFVQQGKTNLAHDSRDISKGDGDLTFRVNVDKIPDDAKALDVFVALYGKAGDSSDSKQFTYKMK